MNSSNRTRHPGQPSDLGLGVRPGPGVLGLARTDPAGRAAAPQSEPAAQGTLIVGEGIQVRGEIQSCTSLIVEGRVEASLEAAELTVREGGVYEGTAVVGNARIGGSFSGALTVKGLLTVESGGRVSGTLRYRELQIEQGGRLSGDIDLLQEEIARKPEPREAAKPAGMPAGERLLEGAVTHQATH